MSDGEGCTCNAWNESECACDADWTPKELIDARGRIEELTRIIAGLRADLAQAAAAERERCAKVCEDRGNRNRLAANLPNADRDEFYCADDIRALGGE